MSMTELKRTALAKWMFKTGTSGRTLARLAGTSEPTVSRVKNGWTVGIDESVLRKIRAVTGLKKLD